jgi:hypothetical protein
MPLRVVKGIPITPHAAPAKEELEISAPPKEHAMLGYQSLASARRWKHIPQERSQWCWAACAQMIADYFGRNVSQCSLARRLFSVKKCCESGSGFNSSCDQGCDRTALANRIYPSFLRLNASLKENAIQFCDIIDEITNNRRPVLVGLKWTQGGLQGGHLVVISGWSESLDPEDGWLTVHDPLEGEEPQMEVRYSYLRTAYGFGEWQDTWVNITRQ